MDFGLFLEFSGQENDDEAKVFQQGFSLIDEAESLGVDSVWLPDKVVYGTPDRVVDRLQQLTEELHLTQIVYEINFGRQIPHELQSKCLRLLTEQVFPKIR